MNASGATAIAWALLGGCRPEPRSAPRPEPAPEAPSTSPTSPTGATTPPPVDADGDTWPADQDCDDQDPTIHPGAPDEPYDGVDADCAGDDDFDADRDGFPIPADCDDDHLLRHPGAVDVSCDAVDADCDGDTGDSAACALSTADASATLVSSGTYPTVTLDPTGDGLPDVLAMRTVAECCGWYAGVYDNDVLIEARGPAGLAVAATLHSEFAYVTWDYTTNRGVQTAFSPGDVNGDGRDDLWALPFGSDNWWLLPGPFSGERQVESGIANSPSALFEDLDADGIADSATLTEACLGPFGGAVPASCSPWTPTVDLIFDSTDLDGDGLPEVLGANIYGPQEILALDPATGAETGAWAFDLGYTPQFAYFYRGVAGDLDGDGTNDVLTTDGGFYGPLDLRSDLLVPDVLVDGLTIGAGGPLDLDGDGAGEVPSGNWWVHLDAPGSYELDEVSYALDPFAQALVGSWQPGEADGIARVGSTLYVFGPSSW